MKLLPIGNCFDCLYATKTWCHLGQFEILNTDEAPPECPLLDSATLREVRELLGIISNAPYYPEDWEDDVNTLLEKLDADPTRYCACGNEIGHPEMDVCEDCR